MKNNNVKLLAWALIAAISIWSIGVSFANDSVSNSSWSLNKKIERLELTVEEKAEMDTIKAILDKKKAGEILTDEEQSILDKFEANKISKENIKDLSEVIEKWHGDKLKVWHKKTVDNLINKFTKSLDWKEDNIKKTSLNSLLNKVEIALNKLENNSSVSNSKKETYTNILEYLQESIETTISDLESSEDDDILSDLGL